MTQKAEYCVTVARATHDCLEICFVVFLNCDEYNTRFALINFTFFKSRKLNIARWAFLKKKICGTFYLATVRSVSFLVQAIRFAHTRLYRIEMTMFIFHK